MIIFANSMANGTVFKRFGLPFEIMAILPRFPIFFSWTFLGNTLCNLWSEFDIDSIN